MFGNGYCFGNGIVYDEFCLIIVGCFLFGVVFGY